jgi:hypothetical protein
MQSTRGARIGQDEYFSTKIRTNSTSTLEDPEVHDDDFDNIPTTFRVP